jgi:hypothetical protein
MTADNLLYIDNPSSMLAGAKGSPEYAFIMEKLQEQVYKHQGEKKKADNKLNKSA